MKLLMFLPFHLVLKPLIKRNYRLRAAKLLPDEWYWADRIAVHYGYFVSSNEQNSMELASFTKTSKTNPRISKGLSHNGAPGGYIDERPLVPDA